ncbi:MAG: DUF2807 domain-containing protein [Planctomycetota bacterium]|nr:DUF2807 domain-containing protein [Planctomycetota bacterium]
MRAPSHLERLRAGALFAAGTLALLAACTRPVAVIHGSGAPVQERREFRPVERVTVEGGLELTVHVVGSGDGPLAPFSRGGGSLLWIEAPDDIVHLVEHVVTGDHLTLRVRDGLRLDPVPSLELTVRRLAVLEANGAGEVDLRAGAASATGSPPMCERLRIVARGSVGVRGRGTVGALEILQEGSGDLRLERLRAGALLHRSRGSGNAWVHVDGPVEVELLGSCDLHVSGDAVFERIDARGDGEVIRPTRGSDDARSPR